MRLFKRRSLDQSPELVSATPISQDVEETSEYTESKRPIRNAEEAIETAGTTTLTTPRRLRNEIIKGPKQQNSNIPFSAKSLTSWSRLVGEKLDQLRRTDSSLDLHSNKKFNQKPPKPSSPEFAKPKRISRVESLRNLFKASTSSSNLKKSTSSIKEEEECNPEVSQRMEKSLSEGALKMPRLRNPMVGNLNDRRWELTRSIHDLEQQTRALDYLLEHQDVLKTQQGKVLAKKTIYRTATIKKRPFSGSAFLTQHRERTFSEGSNDELNSSTISNCSSEAAENDIERNLLNVEASVENNRTEAVQPSVITNLEDLMSGLKLACDESGYDSDSTRAGADSPDSEKSVTEPTYSNHRASISLTDYSGVDLSLMRYPNRSKSKRLIIEDEIDNKSLNMAEFADQEEEELLAQDETTILNDTNNEFNDSSKTDVTILVEEERKSYAMLSRQTSMESGVSRLMDTGISSLQNVNSQLRTPEKKRPSQEKSRLSILKPQHCKSNASILNLLDNASSPCKDSPPLNYKTQGIVARAKSQLQFCHTKRTHSAVEPEVSAEVSVTIKRQIFATPSPTTNKLQSGSAIKTPFTPRRDLKTVKLNVEKVGNVGISVQKCDAVRPYFIISSLDKGGDAAKSKLFKVGDEIVRVSGRRLRGMSLVEAKNALKNCIGAVDIQVAREPSMFDYEGLCGQEMVRSSSDSEVWGPKMIQASTVEMKFESPSEPKIVKRREIVPEKLNETKKDDDKKNSLSCEIIGAVTKDGRTVSVQEMECSDSEEQKVTGMKKFQVRKRSSTLTSGMRRATSLSMDLITVTLEKGGAKRLGFTIVGGTDSKKGPMGIFVKDILPGGQAAEQGTLKVEDEILAINGIPLEGLTHARVLQIFKTAKKGKIVLHIGRRDQSHRRLLKQQHSEH